MSSATSRASKTPTGKPHYLILYNPRSGPRKRSREKALADFFHEQGLAYTFLKLEHEIDFRALQSAFGFTHIIVAGGDGTLRHTVQALYDQNFLNVKVGFFPNGSGNLFARSMGIPLNPKKCLRFLLQATPTPFDLGLVNKKHVFLICACFGKATEVILKAEDEKGVKRAGMLSYWLTFFRVLWHLPKKHFQLQCDQSEPQDMHAHSVLVTNHLRLYLNPKKRNISPFDRKLDGFVSSCKSFPGFLKTMYVFFRRSGNTPDLAQITFSEKLTLSGEKWKDQMIVDGDRFDIAGDKVTLEVLPGKIEILL